MHTFNLEDINTYPSDLPAFLFGIGKPKKQAVKIAPLTESIYGGFSDPLHAENDKAIKHAIHGTDYHADLDRLHTFVRPYVPEGQTHNAEDNYIHDTLKKGKPAGEGVKHILDVIHDGAFGGAYQSSKYLKHKWEPFLNAHLAQSPKIKDPQQAGYSLDQLKEVHPAFEFRNLRMVAHPSQHLFEQHPDEGLRYLGNNGALHTKANANRMRDTRSYANISEDLHKHYASYPSDELREYTRDSSHINKNLYGALDPEDHADIDTERLTRLSDDLSGHIKRVPHAQTASFSVYTGIHHLNNPQTVKEETESGEKIIRSPSFVSTSLNRLAAEDFAGPKKDNTFHKNFRDVLKIEVPGGYPHGVFAKPSSEHTHEEEYILDKNHTFIVHPKPSYYTGNNTVYRMWHARIHPRDELGGRDWNSLHRSEKAGIALSPHIDADTLHKAADDFEHPVRAAAAKHPNISMTDIETLSKDDVSSVREAALSNPRAPHHLIENAFAKNDTAALRGVARRAHLDEHHKDRLVNNDFPSVQREVAKRSDLSNQHIHDLIKNGDTSVHEVLARNTSIKPEHVDSLIHHADTSAIRELSLNPAVTKAHLRKFSEDNDIEIRMNSRNNPRNSMLD